MAEPGCAPGVPGFQGASALLVGGHREGTRIWKETLSCLLSSMTSLLKSPDSDLLSILEQDCLIHLNFFYFLYFS